MKKTNKKKSISNRLNGFEWTKKKLFINWWVRIHITKFKSIFIITSMLLSIISHKQCFIYISFCFYLVSIHILKCYLSSNIVIVLLLLFFFFAMKSISIYWHPKTNHQNKKKRTNTKPSDNKKSILQCYDEVYITRRQPE